MIFMAQQSTLQRIVFHLGMVSHLVGVGCLAYALLDDTLSKAVYASFLASMVFFIGVGVVLNVIGATNLPSLKPEKPPEPRSP